ncbi:MAG: HD domain-containing protein [Gemmatimonadota bacterium]
MSETAVGAVLRALSYAAAKHRDQRRKGAGAPPFINHSIEVAELLARAAGIEDPVTLQAAVLHDTLEDTDTTFDDLAREFGTEVATLVQEVTDEKHLPRAERKRHQIETAPRLSERARLIRLADKIVNVHAITWTPPVEWPLERRLDYLEWTAQVVEHCRGSCEPLERLYDQVLADGMKALSGRGGEFRQPPSSTHSPASDR